MLPLPNATAARCRCHCLMPPLPAAAAAACCRSGELQPDRPIGCCIPISSSCHILRKQLGGCLPAGWGLRAAMSRSVASCAARLLRRVVPQCGGTGWLPPAAAAATQPVYGFSARSFAAAAAQGSKRLQSVVSQLQGAASARAVAATGAGGGAGLAVAAAAARQQSRGFARYLQFQPRQVRRWDANPNHVLYGLMGINVAGWVAWQIWPRQVGCRAGRSARSHCAAPIVLCQLCHSPLHAAAADWLPAASPAVPGAA